LHSRCIERATGVALAARVVPMVIATGSAGFLVSLFEEAATAIGAGIIVGSFAGATGGVVFGWSRRQVEGNALRDGYFGAAFVLGAWLFHQCIVYAASTWTT
jgi:hypothetical protein